MARRGDDDPPDRRTAGGVTVTDERVGGGGVDTERLGRLATSVLAQLGVPADMAVDVLCVDRDAMTELNREHMDGDGPTDVLAFPLDAPGEAPDGVPALLGDVVLCPEVAAAQAAEAGKPAEAELDMLLVHGLLHLLGHDHEDPEERRVMFALTDDLLAAHGAAP